MLLRHLVLLMSLLSSFRRNYALWFFVLTSSYLSRYYFFLYYKIFFTFHIVECSVNSAYVVLPPASVFFLRTNTVSRVSLLFLNANFRIYLVVLCYWLNIENQCFNAILNLWLCNFLSNTHIPIRLLVYWTIAVS